MLNFITIKKDSRFEYRLYTDTQQDFEGKIIYKGHKLGVDEKVLSNILEFKMERTSNRVYVRDYDSEDKWFVGSSYDSNLVLNQSYESLQKFAESKLGKFRKILITRF